MNVTKKIENEKTIIAVEGRIETATSEEFERAINELDSECKELVLDFTKLEFTSSIGLRTILNAYNLMQDRYGKISIVGCNSEVKEVLEMTGFKKIMNID